MQCAIVYFEYSPEVLHRYRTAHFEAAKCRGLVCILVTTPNRNDKDQLKCDAYIELDKWNLASLKSVCSQISKFYKITAVLSYPGMYDSRGLLGADIALLAESLKLPNQNADALHRTVNKYLMRDALRSANIPTVDYALVSNNEQLIYEAARIGYPVILKPICGAASAQIHKCINDEQLLRAFRYMRNQLPKTLIGKTFCNYRYAYKKRNGELVDFDFLKDFLLEKYIEGREASVECLVVNSEVFPLLIHDKIIITERNRTVLENCLVSPPMSFTVDEIEQMKSYAVKAIQATGLKNSIVHFELRYDVYRGPQVLEINPRVGGSFVKKSLVTFVNIEPFSTNLSLLTGELKNFILEPTRKDIHSMFWIFPPHSGKLKRVDGLEKLKTLPGMLDTILMFPPGSAIECTDEECFLVQCWMKANSYEEVLETYHRACETVQIEVEPLNI